MKKITFTMQVFGVIAAFPLCIIAAMSHMPAQFVETSSRAESKPEQQVSMKLPDTKTDFVFQYLIFKTN